MGTKRDVTSGKPEHTVGGLRRHQNSTGWTMADVPSSLSSHKQTYLCSFDGEHEIGLKLWKVFCHIREVRKFQTERVKTISVTNTFV
jgi:hypothetical protein